MARSWTPGSNMRFTKGARVGLRGRRAGHGALEQRRQRAARLFAKGVRLAELHASWVVRFLAVTIRLRLVGVERQARGQYICRTYVPCRRGRRPGTW